MGIRVGDRMSAVYYFLTGGVMVTCGVAGVFFFSFWKKTGDRLFFVFAFAFWILAIERVVLLLLQTNNPEKDSSIYLLRLLSFLLILMGIAAKNRSLKIR